ncbi:MAG: XdhC/CoxI family protein [Elusimicrobiaceae bacterium]|nr:XdhC/CoxI family protein [Elusimicrobiaceae bacterium]
MIHETIYALLDRAIAQGRDAALVTIIGSQGSTPRETGAKMLVFADGETAGTVGGGKLESLCIESARAAIGTGECRRETFDLTASGIGMECAGRNEIFIEVFVSRIKLLILGGGHVGQKIAQAAALAGIGYSVADDRAEFANAANFPLARNIYVEPPDTIAALADEKTCVVIVTRGHSLDQECLAAALKTPARYIGMIGSKQKVPGIFANLNKQGLHPETDPRVYSPVGLRLGGKTPGEIAISVLAEILMVCHNETGKHNSIVKAA